jgi:hypothetical protein
MNKPAFMGAKPWPWVDPSTGTTSTLPAKARFDNGTPNDVQYGTPPTVANPPSASPSTITGTTTSLSTLGADPGGEPSLTYTWSATGPAPVTFTPNGTNAAKNTTAIFSAAGSYTLTVTIQNPGGGTVTSSTTVTINQTYASVGVSPASASVIVHGTKQLTATAEDQFGQAMATQPTFTWSVNGGGTISGTGLFTAGGASGGPFTVTAIGGGKSGTASVTVTSSAPALTMVQVTPATATVAPGYTRAFTAVGLDQFGNPMSPAPSFTWTLSGGGTIDPTGLFTAAATSGGPFTVTATSGLVSGTASVTVASPLPSVGGGHGGGGCGLLGLEGVALALLAGWRRARQRMCLGMSVPGIAPP